LLNCLCAEIVSLHFRRTLSPETFDRKAARVALEMRIAGRPPTASPPMTRSHIFLGWLYYFNVSIFSIAAINSFYNSFSG